MDYQVRTVANDNSKQVIFQPVPGAEINKNVIPKINSQPFLLPVKPSGWLKELQFSYQIGQKLSLLEFFRQYSVGKATVIHILESTIRPLLHAKSTQFLPDNFVLDLDYIFYDTSEEKVYLIYLPFDFNGQAGLAVMYIIARILGECLTPPKNEDSSYISQILAYYNDPRYNAKGLLQLLDQLKGPQGQDMPKLQVLKQQVEQEEHPVAPGLQVEPFVVAGPPLPAGTLTKTPKASAHPKAPAISQKQAMMLSVSIKGMMNELEIQDFPCILGRSTKGANIFFEDASVSRKHATLDYHAGDFTVVDNNSSNGVTLNGEVITPGVTHPVRRGDTLKLGLVEVTIVDLVGA